LNHLVLQFVGFVFRWELGHAEHDFSVNRVAVIGAGPCGLAAAKYLSAQKAFDTVVVYERQTEVGGVWNYSRSYNKRSACLK
jgi:cation diffusion facilitator CzcD-associated flavoprotein CzcO